MACLRLTRPAGPLSTRVSFTHPPAAQITDTCPCYYPANGFSNRRWCALGGGGSCRWAIPGGGARAVRGARGTRVQAHACMHACVARRLPALLSAWHAWAPLNRCSHRRGWGLAPRAGGVTHPQCIRQQRSHAAHCLSLALGLGVRPSAAAAARCPPALPPARRPIMPTRAVPCGVPLQVLR